MASSSMHTAPSVSLFSGARPVASHLQSALSKKLAQISEREGEDAVLTGGTRSLSRRLLALNVAEVRSHSSVALESHEKLSA